MSLIWFYTFVTSLDHSSPHHFECSTRVKSRPAVTHYRESVSIIGLLFSEPARGSSIITLCNSVTFWLTRMLRLLQRLSTTFSPPLPHLRLLCKPRIHQGGLTATKLVEQADKAGQIQSARCCEHEIGEWWDLDGFKQICKIDKSTGLHSIYIARLLLKATSGGDD